MYTVLMIIHVLVSIALILVILMQSSKGGALDGMLGGTASNVLGGQAAPKFLQNATKILAFVFMLMCILMAFQLKSVRKSSSKAIDQLKKEAAEQPLEEDVPVLPTEEQPVEIPAGE